MATVTTPGFDAAATNERVTHPLQRLRGIIRLYVGAEGLAVLVLYLALWFWIGLALDYGFFKLFTIDWVQELPHGFRVFVLCGLTAGLVAVVVLKVALRLFREFRDPALALVLERRFPRLLGDRLITAVELADTEKAAQFGYSRVMIEQTIRDAAERVDQLDIREVFDWKRLRRLGLTALLLTIGLYVIVGATSCLVSGSEPGAFISRFNDVAITWFERNILLIDKIWPRQAHLELLNFPGDEIKVGRDAPPTTLRVRAWKWVIADSDRSRAPEGWRPLTWADLTLDVVGADVKSDAVPEDWRELSLDDIDLRLTKPDVVGFLPAETVMATRAVFDKLHERAASGKWSRRFRELIIPESLTVYLKGANRQSDQTLQQDRPHEYSGSLELKETVRFTVRGEDYYTPSKRITVVPPPTLVRLEVQEDQPAYLYHRIPADGTADDLRNRKHQFPAQPVSLTGDTSRRDVPAGSDVVLIGESDKPLRLPDGIRILPPRPNAPAVKAAVEQLNPTTFQTNFEHVTGPIDLVFEFTDTDQVVGRRHVLIKPVEDLPPEVDVQVETIRKTNEGYMVTALAEIPFSGKVRDDRGLAGVDYAYNLLQSGSNLPWAAGAMSAASGGFGQHLTVLALVDRLHRLAAADEDKTPRRMPVKTFDDLMQQRKRRDVSVAQFRASLDKPPPEPLLKDHNLDPDVETFNVETLGLKMDDDRADQTTHRMRLWVVATDNNIETGPGIGLSKEKFTFAIVSENRLLLEIAKEEEGLRIKLEETITRIKEGRIKLDKVAQEMPLLKPDEFSPMARRAEEIDETLGKSSAVTQEVLSAYQRILKELTTNHVNKRMIAKVDDKIVKPLGYALNEDFVQADESVRELGKKLDAKNADLKAADDAKEKLDKLIDRLSRVLDAMDEVTTINKIIEQLVKIEKAERDEYDRLQKLLKEKEDEIFDNPGDKKEPKKEPEKK